MLLIRKYPLLLLLIVTITQVTAQEKKREERSQTMESFINDLMGKMTLEEKVGQLNLVSIGFDVTGPIVSQNVEAKIQSGQVGGVFNTFTPIAVRKLQQMAIEQTRLKIPLLFGYDVIHGHRTIFPIPLGLSASWDMNLIERTARIAGDEASADGLNWVFSPMVDIARDPRWGRISESGGEDPYLGSKIAEAMVKGLQGNDLSLPGTVMACVKHFALYGAAQAGRDYHTVDMSERTMRQEYLVPYKAAIDAGVQSVMSSFNDINGIPAAANEWLLRDLLRKEWGFNGLVASDYTGVMELVPHGISADAKEAAADALIAGNDMDMVSEFYVAHLPELVKEGKVSMQLIDEACRRVLEAKYKLGLFDDPYRYVNEKRAKETLMQPSYREAARDAARKSFVLLKNEGNTLPLKRNTTVALVGPLARNQRDMIGNWSGAGDWKQAVSVEQGLKNVGGKSLKINYAKGANITDDQQLIQRLNAHGGELEIDPRSADEMIREAVQKANMSDVVVAVVGESQGMSGEAASRADLSLPGKQLDLLKALKNTGKPLVVVLMSGRPLTITWEAMNTDAILQTWFAGTEAGNAIADVLFGDYNPSGKISATFPRHVGQIPIFYSAKSTGRPFNGELLDKYKSRYLDVPNEPLYPFGFGLSYSKFEYNAIKLSKAEMNLGETITATCSVTNKSNVAGEEVVQFYIQDIAGSVTRPVKELKGFQKILLKPGETREVTFQITEQALSFYRSDMSFGAEPGDFKVFIGGNSRDVLEASFSLKKR